MQSARQAPVIPAPLWREFTLLGLPDAPGCARRLTVQALQSWGMDALTESAALIVSELVTNAAKATADGKRASLASSLRPHPGPTTVARLGQIQVWLTSDRARLLIEVSDQCPRPPYLVRDASPDAEGGRGLVIVGTLSAQWGWYPTPAIAVSRDTGKVVWCVIENAQSHCGPQDLLRDDEGDGRRSSQHPCSPGTGAGRAHRIRRTSP